VVIILLFSNKLFADDVYRFDMKRQFPIIATSSILSVTALLMSNNDDIIPEDRILKLNQNDINFIDRSAANNYSPSADRISDYLLYVCVLAPFALNFNEKDINFAVLEAYLVTGALVSLTKVTSQRLRPLAYNPDLSLSQRQQKRNLYSFYSGHTAFAFTGAVATAKIYGDLHPNSDKTLLYSTAVATAGTVGFLRVRAGQHFPTDVLVGGVVGTATTLLILEGNKSAHRHNDSKYFQFQIDF
jgi:membrane-associated phospholipid phosphatase